MRPFRRIIPLALIGISILTGPAARADNDAPRVVSLSRVTTAPAAGQPVRLDVEVSDGGTSTVTHVQAVYRGPRGHFFVPSVHFGQSSGRGVASATLNAWAATGGWSLTEVIVYDRADNRTHYRRDGSTQTTPSGARPAEPTSIDFAAADFELTNANEDVTAPSIDSIRAVFGTVIAGTAQAAIYEASDDRSGIASVSVQYFLPGRAVMFLSSPPADLIGVGPVAGVVPLFTEGGHATLAHVAVIDRADNRTIFSVNNGVLYSPGGIEPAATVNVDRAKVEFDVQAVAPDGDYPSVESFEMRSSRVLRAGERVTIAFSVSDPTTLVSQVGVGWRDQYGHQINEWYQCVGLREGTISATIPSFVEPGTRWALHQISVMDRAKHGTGYRSDGVTTREAGNVVTPHATHTFDLSAGDFEIEAGAPRQENLPAPKVCDRPTLLDVVADPSEVASGETSSLRGSVRAGGAPVGDPVAALYEYEAGRPKLLNVVRGASGGTFARTIAPENGKTYRARFLGSDGHNPADPAFSPPVQVRVVGAGKHRSALHGSAPDWIRAGAPATVAALLTDADTSVALAGRTVVLEARPAGAAAFRRVATAATGSDGRVRWTVRPDSTTDYRVSFAGDAGAEPVVSAPRRVQVAPRTWLLADRTRLPRGATASLTTGVAPSHAGHTVVLLRRAQDRWVRVATARLDGSSRAVFRFQPPAGSWTYSVATSSHADHRWSQSPSVTLSVG
ncbi:MAG TPA: hypothetical protein VM841_01375 [Actinomycetota bacterium]|nr:hypothetical protein [Actinomycetota bacterium]